MGRLKIGSSNEVLATEVLVVSKNVASWVWLTPLLGYRRVGIFLSEPVSWSFSGVWKESAIEVVGLRTLANAIHSIGTEDWNYALCLIQERSNCFSDIFIQLRCARPGLSILGVATGRHYKRSKYL